MSDRLSCSDPLIYFAHQFEISHYFPRYLTVTVTTTSVAITIYSSLSSYSFCIYQLYNILCDSRWILNILSVSSHTCVRVYMWAEVQLNAGIRIQYTAPSHTRIYIDGSVFMHACSQRYRTLTRKKKKLIFQRYFFFKFKKKNLSKNIHKYNPYIIFCTCTCL